MVVENIFRHFQPSVASRYQSGLAIAAALLSAHPILPLVALLGADVAEALVENFRSSALACDERILKFVAALR